MPGMMDTVLNLGLKESSVQALAKKTRNERFAYDSYRRFIEMYGNVVMEVKDEILEEVLKKKKEERGGRLDTELAIEDLKELAVRLQTKIEESSGKKFPLKPKEQLWVAISAVFESWNNPRAIAYREINQIPHNWGTAVTLNGRQVIEELSKVRKDFKVLYMSGYPENTYAHHGILEPEIEFIKKPFTMEELARKVRCVLNK